MAPFTPLISTVLPAATRPCHWKSWADAVPASRSAAAPAAQAIPVLMRPPWSLETPPARARLEGPEAAPVVSSVRMSVLVSLALGVVLAGTPSVHPAAGVHTA